MLWAGVICNSDPVHPAVPADVKQLGCGSQLLTGAATLANHLELRHCGAATRGCCEVEKYRSTADATFSMILRDCSDGSKRSARLLHATHGALSPITH